MRELVSKLKGGCMIARFHLASRARTRAAENAIPPDCLFWGRGLTGVGPAFRGDSSFWEEEVDRLLTGVEELPSEL